MASVALILRTALSSSPRTAAALATGRLADALGARVSQQPTTGPR